MPENLFAGLVNELAVDYQPDAPFVVEQPWRSAAVVRLVDVNAVFIRQGEMGQSRTPIGTQNAFCLGGAPIIYLDGKEAPKGEIDLSSVLLSKANVAAYMVATLLARVELGGLRLRIGYEHQGEAGGQGWCQDLSYRGAYLVQWLAKAQ
jgi:hypothetical protein